MPRNNRNWSPEDDKHLLQLFADGKTVAFVAKVLQRTEAAVSSRASTIKHRLLLASFNTPKSENQRD